jgi:23S rRNA pseudouridine955/2504/2580 synthase
MNLDRKFSKVQFVEVDEHRECQRVDNFLLAIFKNIPKSKVYRIIRKGEVRVNKKRVKPDYKLSLHDCVRIPPMQVQEQVNITPGSAAMDILRSAIILDTDDFMALNKPSGFAVHGGTGVQGGVINILRHTFQNYQFIELIHRLDKETSGCLLIAKSGHFLKQCQQAWKDNLVEKHYQCLVKGHWPKSLQTVEAPLRKNVMQSGERIVRVDPEGKSSITHFRPLQYFDDSTLLSVGLETGRTHQIRVHTAHMGHPIAGDVKYGNKEFNKAMKQQGLRRLFLHSNELILPETLYYQKSIIAELPEDLKTLIKKIML